MKSTILMAGRQPIAHTHQKRARAIFFFEITNHYNGNVFNGLCGQALLYR
jgi:hypothetical protein